MRKTVQFEAHGLRFELVAACGDGFEDDLDSALSRVQNLLICLPSPMQGLVTVSDGLRGGDVAVGIRNV
ncbi:hypothetical protein KJ782_07115 [Patescibacteria group bacterium]|nr:hypothetical protein [Patescibacteria group bacterium]